MVLTILTIIFTDALIDKWTDNGLWKFVYKIQALNTPDREEQAFIIVLNIMLVNTKGWLI